MDPSLSVYEPAAHFWHVRELGAPTAAENVPTPHLVHWLAAPKLNVPASHSVCPVEPIVMFQDEAEMQAVSVGWQSGAHCCVFGTVMLPGPAGEHICEPAAALK